MASAHTTLPASPKRKARRRVEAREGGSPRRSARREGGVRANTRLVLYSLYGATVASDRSIDDRLHPGSGSPDLTLTWSNETEPVSLPADAPSSYVSPFLTADGASMLRVYELEGAELLRFPGIADFLVARDTIHCRIFDEAREYLARIYVLGTVLAFWLERRGIPAMHASAVVTPHGVVAFLSDTGAGKSALAMAFVSAGYPLLTDDILPVESTVTGFVGRPGYPVVRLWPDQADHFVGAHQQLERVDPSGEKRRVGLADADLGAFFPRSERLARFYLPVRRDPHVSGTAIEIARVPPSQAVFELLRNLFAVRMVHAMRWHPDRLRLLSSLAAQVPVCRLSYPSGFEHLPQVRDAVLADLG